ncbi:MAG: cytochrome c3 family protein [Dissulfurispiraceae bacterium]
MKVDRRIRWIVFIIFTALSVGLSNAQEKAPAQGQEHCLKCHGEKGSVKEFPDGDFISAYVDPKALDKSVHRSLRCTDCHREFSDQQHPNRAFRNKLQYQVKESRACRDCHPENIISSRPIHRELFKKEKTGEAVVCANCHGAHAVTPISGGNLSMSEANYCLSCHAYDNKMVFRNGESISVRVNIAELKDSLHKNVSCSDCHFGFAVDDHPRRRFGSEREYRVSSPDICRRCHFDKLLKVSESIHYAVLSKGGLEAPTCIDCHGVHAVLSLSNNRLLVVQKCKTCHGAVYEIYARSVHGSDLIKKNSQDVPICTDCHIAHGMKDTSSSAFHDYIPDTCSKCHSNAAIMNKYGLSTDVVKTYLADFHGITLNIERQEAQRPYRPDRPLAVCTDCHGSHDISSVSGADIQVVKKNLLKRCQTCHANATKNFPDAWLSHYKPSLAVAPVVYIIEKFYKIMLPLMVVGLLFQVFLHVWRHFLNK